MTRPRLRLADQSPAAATPLPPSEPPTVPVGRTDLMTARRFELLQQIPAFWRGRERTRVTLAGEHDDLSEERLRQLTVANSYFARARELEMAA